MLKYPRQSDHYVLYDIGHILKEFQNSYLSVYEHFYPYNEIILMQKEPTIKYISLLIRMHFIASFW